MNRAGEDMVDSKQAPPIYKQFGVVEPHDPSPLLLEAVFSSNLPRLALSFSKKFLKREDPKGREIESSISWILVFYFPSIGYFGKNLVGIPPYQIRQVRAYIRAAHPLPRG
jgi:hypothetical protein